MFMFLIAAPLFFIAAYFIKDQRTRTAFVLLGVMCLVSWLVAPK